jgi:EPS-associated MarR family transcriptional regulator
MNESLFNTLRELSKYGEISQRELSKKMGISLGKVNYLINELIKRGYIKVKTYKNTKNREAFKYIITPKGETEKKRQTMLYLEKKNDEIERLKKEIEELTLSIQLSP